MHVVYEVAAHREGRDTHRPVLRSAIPGIGRAQQRCFGAKVEVRVGGGAVGRAPGRALRLAHREPAVPHALHRLPVAVDQAQLSGVGAQVGVQQQRVDVDVVEIHVVRHPVVRADRALPSLQLRGGRAQAESSQPFEPRVVVLDGRRGEPARRRTNGQRKNTTLDSPLGVRVLGWAGERPLVGGVAERNVAYVPLPEPRQEDPVQEGLSTGRHVRVYPDDDASIWLALDCVMNCSNFANEKLVKRSGIMADEGLAHARELLEPLDARLPRVATAHSPQPRLGLESIDGTGWAAHELSDRRRVERRPAVRLLPARFVEYYEWRAECMLEDRVGRVRDEVTRVGRRQASDQRDRRALQSSAELDR
mmetsp:Transcript_1480/g.3715  ORF Transcript_1480/g.3715 Transcript_1480/m.3715 type:complete len:363 (-) Transcript_1480:74-1162(-)